MAAARARPAFAPAELEQRRPALRLGPEPLPELALAQPLDPPPNPTLRTHPLTPPRWKPAWMPGRGRLGVADNQESQCRHQPPPASLYETLLIFRSAVTSEYIFDSMEIVYLKLNEK